VNPVAIVVVGVDGSEQSRRALDWALPYAVTRGATVQVITTVDTKDLDDAEREARWSAANRMLSGLVADALAGEARPTVCYEAVEGDPAVVLVDATRGADLIVLGSHGMSSIRNPALGSVSLACIRLGSCPVLVIPAGRPEPVVSGDVVRC
jgi:nucleotide-binding universal stress UspA family protein